MNDCFMVYESDLHTAPHHGVSFHEL